MALILWHSSCSETWPLYRQNFELVVIKVCTLAGLEVQHPLAYAELSVLHSHSTVCALHMHSLALN